MTVLIVGGMLGGIESYWRTQGHFPSVIDDKDLWCLNRETISKVDGKLLVLLGNSRIVHSFDTKAFAHEAKGYYVIQLGVPGLEPLASLQDLADDESFHGTVVYDVTPLTMVPGTVGGQDDHVRYYHSAWNAIKRFDRRLRTKLQERSVYASIPLNPIKLAKHVITGTKLPPVFAKTYPDRWSAIDFSQFDLQEVTRDLYDSTKEVYENTPPFAPESLQARLEPLITAVKRIEARGGHVVMFRNISSGGIRELERQYQPRDRVWDPIASYVTQATGAAVIHYEDIPELAALECVEGSHLDHRDAVTFTKVFVKELRQRKLLKS